MDRKPKPENRIPEPEVIEDADDEDEDDLDENLFNEKILDIQNTDPDILGSMEDLDAQLVVVRRNHETGNGQSHFSTYLLLSSPNYFFLEVWYHHQYDKIGRILKFSGGKFSNNSSQKVGDTFIIWILE